MAITLPDEADAWIDAYRARLNDSDEFAAAADGWGVEFDGDLVFEILPDETYDGDPLYLYFGLRDGECLETELLADPNAVAHGFTIRADYADWKRLLTGEIDIIQSVMDGTFDVDGSTMRAMRYQDVFVEMCATAVRLDTQFRY
jgi:putative sterol carrier protein